MTTTDTRPDPSAKRDGQYLHLNIKSNGTTYVEHNPERHTLTPHCQKCPDWLGTTLTYNPAAKSGPTNIRMALLRTNKDTVWHAVEHGGPIPRPA